MSIWSFILLRKRMIQYASVKKTVDIVDKWVYYVEKIGGEMTDNKITISRSFSRKMNLGNYESADFFSSRSKEIPAETPIIEQQEVSEELFSLAQIDTERDADSYLRSRDKGVSIESLLQIIDEVSIGNPFSFDDFEDLAPWQHKIVQSIKRAYQRSPLKKGTEEPNPRNLPDKE